MAYRGSGGNGGYRDDYRGHGGGGYGGGGGGGGGYREQPREYREPAPRYPQPSSQQQPAPHSSGPRPGAKAAGYTLFVGGLSDRVRSADVAREFERFGQLVRVDIPLRNGRSKGFAFVEFIYKQDCDHALEASRGRLQIDGQPVTIELTQRDYAPQPRAAVTAPHDGPRDTRPRSRSPPPRRDRSPVGDYRDDRDRGRDRERDRDVKRPAPASRSPPPRDRSPPRRSPSPPRR